MIVACKRTRGLSLLPPSVRIRRDKVVLLEEDGRLNVAHGVVRIVRGVVLEHLGVDEA